MVANTAAESRELVELELSRRLLNRAEASEARGDLLAAGVLLRESLRRKLLAIAAGHGMLPKRIYSQRSPRILAMRLREAGLLDTDGYFRVREMLHIGNIAAHCGHVDQQQLRDAIGAMRTFFESDGTDGHRPMRDPK